jgi:hypothetical protein
MNADEYLKERVEDQIQWLSKKSGFNQRWFKQLRFVEIVLGCAIALLVSYADVHALVKVTSGVLGVAVAAIGGLLSLYRFQENWIEYRVTAENLKREKFLFLTRSTPYDGEDRFPNLVTRIETILGAENVKWAESTALKPAAGPQPTASSAQDTPDTP